MEGLLGGLVKDKDPRAEIVRAELDAMAREAEMTGLKLRRSKAYEEINHAMVNTSATSNGIDNGSGQVPSLLPSRPQNQHILQQQQPQPQQQQQQQRLAPQNSHIMPNPSTQPALGYRINPNPPMHTDNIPSQVSTQSRNQPLLQPSPAPRSGQYQPYEHPRHTTPLKHQPPQHVIQRQPHQPSIVTTSYLKQSQPHYTSSSGDPGVSNQCQQTNYTDSRVFPTGYHQGSRDAQSYHQSQSSRDDDYHQPSNNCSGNNVSNSHYAVDNQQAYGKNGAKLPIGSHLMTTHRPSLAAHQISNPMTGYLYIPESEDDTLILPSMDVIDHLMGVYFHSIHPTLPMLHPQTVSDQIHRNESPPSHLFFAMMGLASRFSDNDSYRMPQPGMVCPPSAIFYERARHFIKEEYDMPHIATVQALLLMSIQQMGFCENKTAWLYVGMAIRMAQELGLNKEPSDQEQSRNRLQCELRKRTWWSVYVVERLVCVGLGRPLSLTRKDCEASFPTYEDYKGDDASGKMHTMDISNFVQLIRLSEIQGSILEFVKTKFSPRGRQPSLDLDSDQDRKIDTSAARFAELDKSLAEWRQNLPESLQNPSAQSPRLHFFLHMIFNTLIILLHRPEVPTSHTSASLCAQAAATISDYIEILMETKVLGSMFISCIYAIFSAGLIHFMNIPSVSKPPELNESHSSHAKTAKTSLKRCIDALKVLSGHWLSAGRRAKVLEDLLDLKHVSLKDLEVDTFKTSPVGPSWVMESQYKEVLVQPAKNQDKLRQRCRSKVMAIQSLLGSDDDFAKMHSRNNFVFPDHNTDNNEKNAEESTGEKTKTNEDNGQEDTLMHPVESSTDRPEMSTSLISGQAPIIGLGVQSPYSSAPSVSSPASTLTDASAVQQVSESDPGMLISTASLGISDSPAMSNGKFFTDTKVENGIAVTTTVQGDASPQLALSSRTDAQGARADGRSNTRSSGTPDLQGAMLDPFSMPSSISFPDWSQPKQSSDSNIDINMSDIASQSESQSNGAKQYDQASDIATSAPQPISLSSESSARPFSGAKALDREEQDLVWNDMPPTLGLDEWTAYIGAMMMRWLSASGQSPSGSSP
ncbi:Transcriptional activator of fatty acid utilization [Mortierella sp. AD010]|nr:Transcriptional activator of fatty acid utilization [Mortierella sp. AD010]